MFISAWSRLKIKSSISHVPPCCWHQALAPMMGSEASVRNLRRAYCIYQAPVSPFDPSRYRRLLRCTLSTLPGGRAEFLPFLASVCAPRLLVVQNGSAWRQSQEAEYEGLALSPTSYVCTVRSFSFQQRSSHSPTTATFVKSGNAINSK